MYCVNNKKNNIFREFFVNYCALLKELIAKELRKLIANNVKI